MASADALRRLGKLQTRDENKECIDCRRGNPTWASVSYGCFLCLECAGHHRSLGVHLSFVRSVGMDSWKEMELKKMEAGGNGALLAHFDTYGVERSTPISEKYKSRAAEVFRAKVQALAEGSKFVAPPVPVAPRAAAASGRSSVGPASRRSSVTATNKPVAMKTGGGFESFDDNWGDWGVTVPGN